MSCFHRQLIWIFITGCLVGAISLCIGCKNVSKIRKAKTSVEKTSVVSIDTGFVETKYVSESTYRYGDTLNASLIFTATKTTDSVESGGIKVKGRIEKNLNGDIHLRLEAIAKPVTKTDRETHSNTTQNALIKTVHQENTISEREKDTQRKVSGGAIALCLFLALLILLFVIWILRTAKNYFS